MSICGISMDYQSSFFLKELHGSRTCRVGVMYLLQMYNEEYPVGNSLMTADSTWQSIFHELWCEISTMPRVESLWATGDQGLEKIILCCRMGFYREHALWCEISTMPRVESLWATGDQGLEKIILCCRMGFYREHAVEGTQGPRAVFVLPFARHKALLNSISGSKIRLMMPSLRSVPYPILLPTVWSDGPPVCLSSVYVLQLSHHNIIVTQTPPSLTISCKYSSVIKDTIIRQPRLQFIVLLSSSCVK